MKKRHVSLILSLALVALLTLAGFDVRCDAIRAGVLRLHILANSDSAADQALKLAVRDGILAECGALFAEVDDLGTVTEDFNTIDAHIERVLALPLVDKEAIAKAGFRIAVDAVNSTGGIAIPRLLRALGVKDVVELNCEPTGHFAHNPEPIPQNLTEIATAVPAQKCDLGIVVDPDVDRLALVCETGEMFGEEYTLVSVADYVLQHTPGNTVSNLSSSRALRDVTHQYAGCEYNAAAVGEVNVTTLMRKTGAVIGGEGNGGGPVPHPACQTRHEGERASQDLSRLYHLQEPHRPHRGHGR